MVRTFLKHISFLVLLNILVKTFYVFGIDRQVQLTVGTLNYGLYFALFNFTYLFQIINEFGIQNYNLSIIASGYHPVRRQLHLVSWTKLYLHLVYLLVLIGVALSLGYGPHLQWLLMIAINQILISWISFLRTFYSGRQFYRQDSWISVLDKALMIIFVGAFLIIPDWRLNFSIGWFLGLQTLSLAITAVVAHCWAGDLHYQGWIRPDFSAMRSMLKACLPFVITVFLMTVYARLDGVMIERLLPDGAHEAGIYAGGYRILDALNMVVFMSAVPLLSIYARLRHEHLALGYLYRSVFWLIGLITTGTSLFIVFYAHKLLPWLYPVADQYWVAVFRPIVLTFIPTGLIMVTSSVFTADGTLAKINGYFLGSIIINFTLNWWLILDHKALGAAWATLITQSLTAVILLWQVYRHYRLGPIRDYLFLLLHVIWLGLGLYVLGHRVKEIFWNHPLWGIAWSGIWMLVIFYVYRQRILAGPVLS